MNVMTAPRWARWVQAASLAGAVLSSTLSVEALELTFLGEAQLPKALAGARLGGLSGVDYDSARGEFVAISDERAIVGAATIARFKLDYDELAGVRLQVVRVDRIALPGDREVRPDCESIRIDPQSHALWCASEGDFERGADPLLWRSTPEGAAPVALSLPDELKFSADGQRGPRPNQTLEGMAFAPDAASLWFALEAPLRPEGEPASITAGCMVRLYRVDRAGVVRRAGLYPVDRIPRAPAPGKLADNGVAEILFLDEESLLVLERSGAQDESGDFQFVIRIFVVDVPRQSPSTGESPLRKTLVLDSRDLKLRQVDNLEGMALGPRLPDGARTLILLADDNFSPRQINQLLLFKILSP